jgi:phosphoribosyl 1,2-cyclic phosphodiesterase
MGDDMEIVFLGVGGGRWTTITQKMKTGGFRIHGTQNIHVDPGPGALVSLCNERIAPMKTDAVVVSHCHPDHYNDAEILIEAVTHGMTRNRGTLACSESVLLGKNDLGPAISTYHASKLKATHILKPGQGFYIGDIKVMALPTKHSDPSAVGLKFYTNDGTVTYTSDTEYYEDLLGYYKDSRVIILNVVRPRGERIPWHLCVDDVIQILNAVKPEVAIMNHFGMKMLGITDMEAKRAEEETGVRTISAKDGMKIEI